MPELLGRTAEPFDLEFVMPDGTEVDGAFLIQVSNNPYVLRASLDAFLSAGGWTPGSLESSLSPPQLALRRPRC